MSELGSGSGSSYPGAIDTDSSLEVNSPAAGKTKARAEVPNDLAAAIIAIETELGIDPAGSATDLVTRLTRSMSDDGDLKPRYEITTSAKTTSYTLVTTDYFVLFNASADRIATLPTAVGVAGKIHYIKNLSTTNDLQINVTSSQTIDGVAGDASGKRLKIMKRSSNGEGGHLNVISDNSNWIIVSSHLCDSVGPVFT